MRLDEACDVVGHLIHGERTDWMDRTRIILAEGESRPFTPFDRFAQRAASRGKSIAELARLRRDNLIELRRLSLDMPILDRGPHRR